MKTTVLSLVAAGAAATLLAAPASADRVDARQDRQEVRIQQGLRDGSLTRREAASLEAEQARIRALERAAERDGHLSREEKRRLEEAQDRASRHIRAERHDEETRGSGRGGNRWSYWGRRNSYSEIDRGVPRPWYRRWY